MEEPIVAPLIGTINFYSNDGTTLLGSEDISAEETRELMVKSNGIFWDDDITVVAVDNLIGLTTTVNSKTPEIAVGEAIDHTFMMGETNFYVITQANEQVDQKTKFTNDMNALADTIKEKSGVTNDMTIEEMNNAAKSITTSNDAYIELNTMKFGGGQ